LLVVSIVTAQKNPLFRNCLLFYFVRHRGVMHHHASITIHVFQNS
jgi:hypothetical protein